MNDFLITTVLVLLAIGIGMSIASWRIRSVQYPPHLRWPKREKTQRKHRSDRDRKDDSEKP